MREDLENRAQLLGSLLRRWQIACLEEDHRVFLERRRRMRLEWNQGIFWKSSFCVLRDFLGDLVALVVIFVLLRIIYDASHI